MTRHAWRLALVLLAAVAAGCAPTDASLDHGNPNAPRISHLRFEPAVIRSGESTRMSFYFLVGTADIEQGFLVERGFSEFQFYQTLNKLPVDLRHYNGQVAGTAEVPLSWTSLGIRRLELYIVTKQGQESNRVSATLTVR